MRSNNKCGHERVDKIFPGFDLVTKFLTLDDSDSNLSYRWSICNFWPSSNKICSCQIVDKVSEPRCSRFELSLQIINTNVYYFSQSLTKIQSKWAAIREWTVFVTNVWWSVALHKHTGTKRTIRHFTGRSVPPI